MAEKDFAVKEEPTYPCKICGRKFIRSSLVKHEPVCKKLNHLNRKPFDSGKQRATGSDISYADVARAAKEREKVGFLEYSQCTTRHFKLGGVYPRPMTNWKERHETFIDAVSSSKKVDYAIKTGAPLPPPPRTAIPSDHVQCNYCGRNFAERAAERHIPFCKEQNARKMTSSSAKSLSGYRKTSAKSETRGNSSAGTAQRRMQEEPPPSQHTRRKSLDTRNTSRSVRSSSRGSSQSAGIRQQPEKTGPVSTAKRSTSAPRTPTSRLKTPTPLATRMKMKS